MKINIYYGGRGILDDPTLFVIGKMTDVFKELNVNVERFPLYELRNQITSLPASINEADGIVLATTVEWYGVGGLMTQFLDACWLYGNKEKISKTYMFPVVMSLSSGERQAKTNLQVAWEILGGQSCSGLCGYVDDMTNFELNSEYIKIIEKKTENLYRTISQKMVSLPSSNQAVKEIVGEGMLLHGLATDAILDDKIEELLNRVGLGKEHMSRFSHEFSGGQRQRIGIARALSVNPEFIVCDEPVSALDVSIQAQVINMLKKLQEEMGLTYLFIAHDLSVVKYISDRIAVMYMGHIVEEAPTETLFVNPLHPYTKLLLSAIPVADPEVTRSRKKIEITGEVPSPIDPAPCCLFADRCPYATERCSKERPERKTVENNHYVSCFNI